MKISAIDRSFSAPAASIIIFSRAITRYDLFHNRSLLFSPTVSLIRKYKIPPRVFPMHSEYFAPSSNSVGVSSHSNSNFREKENSFDSERDFSRACASTLTGKNVERGRSSVLLHYLRRGTRAAVISGYLLKKKPFFFVTTGVRIYLFTSCSCSSFLKKNF